MDADPMALVTGHQLLKPAPVLPAAFGHLGVAHRRAPRPWRSLTAADPEGIAFDAILAPMRASDLFRSLDDAAAARLARRLVRRRYRADEVVFHQGDPGDRLHVIETGRIRIGMGAEDGREGTLTILGPGAVFGELVLLDGAHRSATAVALEPTTTVTLDRAAFRALVDEDAAIREAVLAGVARWLRRLTDQITELHFLDLRGRLAATLVRMAREHGAGRWPGRAAAAHPGGARVARRGHPPARQRRLGELARDGLVARRRPAHHGARRGPPRGPHRLVRVWAPLRSAVTIDAWAPPPGDGRPGRPRAATIGRHMTDRRRYYLTTAIAYPNNRPGLHTLYEVIGADVIARWHRMVGDDTRFLTGTDEHSVNIHQRAQELGQDTRTFIDGMVQLFRDAEDALLIAPDRFIRTTDPDHRRASQEMVRRAFAQRGRLPGQLRGLVLPQRGLPQHERPHRGCARASRCPNHPDVPLQWLTEHNWFFRLSRYAEPLLAYYEAHPEWVQPEYRRNEMLAFIRNGLEDISISRETFSWGIPFPIRADGSDAVLPDGTPDPAAGVIYVWFDALINYITGAGFPDDPDGVRLLVAGRPARHRQGHQPLPHHHLAGDADERGHRPAAPGVGPRLAAHRRRADVQEPRQLPRSA